MSYAFTILAIGLLAGFLGGFIFRDTRSWRRDRRRAREEGIVKRYNYRTAQRLADQESRARRLQSVDR